MNRDSDTPTEEFPKKIGLVRALFSILSLLSIFIIIIIGVIICYRDYMWFTHVKMRIDMECLNQQKQLIRQEAEQIIDFIKYRQSRIEYNLKESLKEHASNACDISTNLYNENKDNKSKEEVQKIILDALHSNRFNHVRGYYFAINFDGNEIFFPDNLQMEGENLIDIQDVRGSYVIRDMIEIVRQKGEDYYDYYWTKSNEKGRYFHIFSYVKLFKPFNGFIGAGEYWEDAEEDIKQDVLRRITNIHFRKSGYISVRYKDGTLLASSSDQTLIGSNQWDITDNNGIKIVQKALQSSENPNGDFLFYHLKKPGTDLIIPIMSFVKLFPEWDWLISVEIDTNDKDFEIVQMEKSLQWRVRSNLTIFGILLLVLLIGILFYYYYISRYFRRQLDIILISFKKMCYSGTPIPSSKIAFKELKILADSANDMIPRLQNAESLLRREKDKVKQYLDIAGVIIVALDQNGNVLLINKKGCEILGYCDTDIIGKNWFENYIPEKYRKRSKNAFLDIIANRREPNEYEENTILCHDGRERVIEWHNAVVRNESGSIVEILSSGKNITRFKKAQISLEARTQELESLFSISTTLRSAHSVDDMISVVLREMKRVLLFDSGAIIMINPDRTNFTITKADGVLSPNTGHTFSINDSIVGIIIKTKEHYITDDYSQDINKISDVIGTEQLGPVILAPIHSEAEFLGVLLTARTKESSCSSFNDIDAHLLTAIGEMLGNALRRVQLHYQALTRLRYVETLHSIDMAITSSLNTRVVMDILLTKVTSDLGIDAAAILLYDPLSLTLEYDVWHGFRSNLLKKVTIHMGDNFAGYAALERRIVYIPDLREIEDNTYYSALVKEEGFVSYFAIPLITKAQVKGVLEIFHRMPYPSTTEWTGFLDALASQAAIAIDNVQIFNELQQSNIELSIAYDTALEAWTRSVNLHNQESDMSTDRLITLTLKLARQVGMNNDYLVHVRRGALLHDIGKILIPDSILLKPDKLNMEEWEIMRAHPRYAYDILSPIACLEPALDIPYCHHEKWDGTGYPRNLKGDDIPFSSQIFSIVDVWDALISDKPYRPAWSKEKALDYIDKQRGIYFNPYLTKDFLKIITKDLNELKIQDWDII